MSDLRVGQKVLLAAVIEDSELGGPIILSARSGGIPAQVDPVDIIPLLTEMEARLKAFNAAIVWRRKPRGQMVDDYQNGYLNALRAHGLIDTEEP